MRNILKKFGVFSLILLVAFSSAGCNSRTVSTAGRFVFNKAKNLVSSPTTKKLAVDVGSGLAVDWASSDNSPIQNNSNAPRNEEKNTSSRRENSSVAAGAVVAATAATAVASNMMNDSDVIKDKHWIKDNSNGIYIQNPSPAEGETISWNGGYVQDGKYKFASGSGTTVWRNSAGEVVQVDEGTFERGQGQGQFKHQFFPSGNVAYSNWQNGKEVADGAGEKIDPANNNPLSGVHYAGTYRYSGLKAYMLLETLDLSSDKKSFNVTVKATGNETVFLDYHIWHDGKTVKFFNSQGFSGDVNPSSTPIEYDMWNFVQKHFGGK